MNGWPIGEMAALGTAMCWTASGLCFEAAGKRIGSLSVNLIRLLQAAVFLSLYTGIMRGRWWPSDATPEIWFWLGLSGFLGFTLGDLCLFRAYVVLGARMSMLVMSMVPPIAALTSWIWLGERLAMIHWAAMGLTLLGIAWVILEKPVDPDGRPVRLNVRGLLLALGGAAGQAFGLVISKYGMGDYDPFAATHIRVLMGIVGFVVIYTAINWWPKMFAALTHTPGIGFTTLGALCGPFLGVSLSLLAIQHTNTGVAATLMALVPVIVLPVTMITHRQQLTLRAMFGALMAVIGSAVLFLF